MGDKKKKEPNLRKAAADAYRLGARKMREVLSGPKSITVSTGTPMPTKRQLEMMRANNRKKKKGRKVDKVVPKSGSGLLRKAMSESLKARERIMKQADELQKP